MLRGDGERAPRPHSENLAGACERHAGAGARGTPDRNANRQSFRLCRRAGRRDVRRAKGARRALLVNEIAPRVHNSGHWTIDGATVSQFEQHIRAVAGWPLAKPLRLGRRVEMVNLIGAEVNDAARWLSVPGASVHVYGKGEARPRRKMGHVTRVWTR